MGYRRVYVEPQQELDSSPHARFRRVLRIAGPAAIAATITLILIAGLILGVGKWMDAMVAAERNVNEILKQQEQARIEEERKKPVTVTIDATAETSLPETSSPSKTTD